MKQQQSISRFFAAKPTGDSSEPNEGVKKKRKSSPASRPAAQKEKSPRVGTDTGQHVE